MKKLWILLLTGVVLLSAACASPAQETTPATPDDVSTATDTTVEPAFDPCAIMSDYDPDPQLFERQSDTDYGTLETDVTYYSTTAGDNKRVNILLPPDDGTADAYPVLYMIHGWGGSYSAHLSEDSYLQLLYGNLYREGLVKPMIIVGVDMYTDVLADKDSKTDEELRYSYDKTVDDIKIDLMPFMEENYPVKTGRENTAVAGVSEGGAKALCTGFKWLDDIGYIAGIAPDTGVIPTKWYEGTFWNIPYFDEFPQPTGDNMPFYVYLPVGSEDPWNLECTAYYSEVLTDMGVKNQHEVVDGFAHNVDFWRVCLYNFMQKIFK